MSYRNTRANDYSTSIAGAEAVTETAKTQRARLRRAFAEAGPSGLTDEEAAEAAGLLDSCYWKRCGELRQDGAIMWTGFTRKGRAGVARKVSAVPSPELRAWLDTLERMASGSDV